MNDQSITQKVWGLLSFVNIIWFFSILGISLSIMPFIIVIFGPIVKRVLELLSVGLIKILKFLLQKIVLPMLNFFNDWGIFELIGYLLCF